MSEKPAYEELKQRVQELEQSVADHTRLEENFRLFVKSFQGLAYQAAADNFKFHMLEGTIEQLTGYDRYAFMSEAMGWDDIVHLEDMAMIGVEIEKVLSDPSYVGDIEYRILRKNGNVHWVRDNFRLVKINEQNLLQGTLVDITERKREEERQQFESTRLMSILDTIPDGVYIVSQQCDIEYINPVIKREFGPIDGRKCYTYFHDRTEICPWCKNAEVFVGKSVKWEWYSIKNNRYYDLFDTPFKNVDGSISKLEIFRDITDSKLAEEALRYSEESLAMAQEVAKIGSWDWNIEANELTWSDETYRQFGVKRNKIIPTYSNFQGFVCPEDRELIDREVQLALEEDKPCSAEARMIRKDGTEWIMHARGKVIRNKEGEPLRFIGTQHDITERRLAEEEIKKFKFISDHSNDAHFLVDSEARFLYVNKVACEKMGYTENELLNLSVPDIDILYDKAKYQELLDLLHREAVPIFETINQSKDGKTFPSEISSTGIQFDGKPHMFAVLRDITERKQAEADIAASLRQKERLLREIHHRVKNNMQVIVSLLRMHSRRIDDERLEGIFEDCRARINAMALVHESLYQSEELAQIDFGLYLKKLCRNLSEAYGSSHKGIAVVLESNEVSLDFDQGVAVGLVISELIVNAFKHAFPLGKGGKVVVSLSRREEYVELIVQDDGMGLPPEIDIMNTPSIGLRLAAATVVRELAGSLDVLRDSGTRFVIRFKYKSA